MTKMPNLTMQLIELCMVERAGDTKAQALSVATELCCSTFDGHQDDTLCIAAICKCVALDVSWKEVQARYIAIRDSLSDGIRNTLEKIIEELKQKQESAGV